MAGKDKGYSPFITAVAGDGKTPPDVRVLTGWLGPTGDETHERLYLDMELSTFVDIPRDALLYSEELANSQPAGASLVWVRNDAALKQGGRAHDRAARFFSGPIASQFCGPVQPFFAPAPIPDPQPTPPRQTPFFRCVTVTENQPLCCPGTAIGCPNPSTEKACESAIPALCPKPNPNPAPVPRMGQFGGGGWGQQQTFQPMCTQWQCF